MHFVLVRMCGNYGTISIDRTSDKSNLPGKFNRIHFKSWKGKDLKKMDAIVMQLVQIMYFVLISVWIMMVQVEINYLNPTCRLRQTSYGQTATRTDGSINIGPSGIKYLWH
jgi:hypothetical protein